VQRCWEESELLGSNEYRAISIRQPWVYAILHLGKDVENRSWYTHFRGRILIHAGLGIDQDEDALKLKIDSKTLQRGKIVGDVEIFSCIDDSRSRWANRESGVWHWCLKNPRYLKTPIPFRGKLGFMLVPAELLKGKRFYAP
jgi:hypothetical protein